MKLLILSMLVATALAAPAAQSLTFHDDGSYRFYYETGKEGGSHTRTEVRNPDGVVIGKFSYEDPDGELREVNYRADETGYVARGDVGVKGAPKGQFPVPQEDQPAQESASSSAATVDDQSAEPKQEESLRQKSEEIGDQQQTEPSDYGAYHDEDGDKDDMMQDLALEESSANDPPEAFPPGFFLAKFQGLRRLPEPTKEDKPATTEAPKEDEKQTQKEEGKEGKEDKEEPKEVAAASPGAAGMEGSVFSFAPPKPFPVPGIANNPASGIPEISHHEWASAMFHQPVYVFAYHHPDAYGYHYYF